MRTGVCICRIIFLTGANNHKDSFPFFLSLFSFCALHRFRRARSALSCYPPWFVPFPLPCFFPALSILSALGGALGGGGACCCRDGGGGGHRHLVAVTPGALPHFFPDILHQSNEPSGPVASSPFRLRTNSSSVWPSLSTSKHPQVNDTLVELIQSST